MKYFSRILSASLLLLGLTACELEPYIITNEELYTRNFIKRFGLVDEEQDYNQAKSIEVKANIGDRKASRVMMYGKHQDKYYLVADLRNVSGLISVPVDVPKSTEDFLVVVDGKNYLGNANAMIDCTGTPAKVSRADVTGMSRGTVISGQSQLYDPETFSNGSHSYNVNGVSVSVGLANGSRLKGEAKYTEDASYQMLNAQQISPIVSMGAWSDYYSMNNGWVGQSGAEGLVPEKYSENQAVGNTQNQGIVQDFVFEPEDGKFTVYPMFYGTNLVHVLGFYLLDEYDQPVCDQDGNPLKFPIYKTKQGDDILVKATSITQIKVKNSDNNYVESNTSYVNTCYINVSGENAVTLDVACLNNGAQLALSDVIDEIQIYNDNTNGTKAYAYKDGGAIKLRGLRNGEQDIYLYVDNGDGKFSSGNELVELKLHINVQNINVSSSDLQSLTVNFTDCTNKSFSATDNDLSSYSQVSLKCTTDANLSYVTLNNIDEYPFEIKCNGGALDVAYLFEDITYSDYTSIFDVYKRDGILYIKANKNGTQWLHIYAGEQGTDSGGNTISQIDIVVEVHVTGITRDGNDTSIFDILPSYGNDRIAWISNEHGWQMLALNRGGGYITMDAENRTGFPLESAYAVTQMQIHEYSESGISYTFENGKLKIVPDDTKPDGKYWFGVTFTKYNGTTGEKWFPLYIDKDAANNYMKYEDPTPSSSAPRRHTASKPQSRSRAASSAPTGSRAAAKPSALTYNANTHWADINKIWKRTGGTDSEPEGTCDAFPTNNPLLVRTRGYDVTVSGDLYKGKIGLYIDVLDNPAVENKHDCYYTGLYQDADGKYPTFPNSGEGYSPFPYTHFSQKSLNARPATEYAINQNPQLAGETFQYSYAATYKHPVSGRLFFSFEDWPVKHAGPNDISLNNKTGVNYTESFSWADHTGEYSSDRDLNDLIFVLYGARSIVTTDETILLTDDSGFDWLWAVEDLGATDDFDFNDMVMKISVITRNESSTSGDGEGNPTGPTEVLKYYKKIVFQPLAAGGTLPLFVQWTPAGKSITYYLKPGIYTDGQITNVVGDSEFTGLIPDINDVLTSRTDDCELHKWFGNYSSTTMINTTEPGKPGKKCTIYVKVDGPEYFQISGFGADSNNLLDAHGNSVGLSVFVDDGRTIQTGEFTTGWTVAKPELGKVSQMFIIYEVPEHKWRWPDERSQINVAYPDFDAWIGNHKIDWVNGRCNGHVIERRD